MITPPAAPLKSNRGLLKKQFPTLLGLLLLVVGLAVAATLFGQGTGIFLPRASPETTPKNIRVSNVSDDGFYVSFYTDSEVPGFVKYGTEKNKYTQVGDERDQLTGAVGNYNLHYIRVKGLQPSTTYYYVLGTGSGALFDDNGEPFVIKTAARSGTQPKVSNAYGTLKTESGLPAEGAVVFVTAPGAGTQSALVRNTGSWAVSLSNARTKDGASYAPIAEGDQLIIQAQGKSLSQKMDTTIILKLEESIDLAFGNSNPGNSNTVASDMNDSGESSALDAGLVAPLSNETDTSDSASPSASLGDFISDSTTRTGGSASEAASGSAEPLTTVVDLTIATDSATPLVVETTQPVIEGKAPANVVLTVEIHSENQIQTQVTTDANGNFSIDVEELGKNLEPGDHEITYTYVDPTTGKPVTVTKEFTVKPRVAFASNNTGETSTQSTSSDTATQIAQVTPTPNPYGTNNPYPVATPRPATGSATNATGSATPKPATASARTASGSARSATSSGTLMASGSVGTTTLLLAGGLFFLISGLWSWWIARELNETG